MSSHRTDLINLRLQLATDNQTEEDSVSHSPSSNIVGLISAKGELNPAKLYECFQFCKTGFPPRCCMLRQALAAQDPEKHKQF